MLHRILLLPLVLILALPSFAAPIETRISLVLMCDIYKMEEENGRGGMARIVGAAKAEKDRNEHVLIAHAGDAISPSLMSGFDQGEHMIELLNQAPLDIFVPGNHEYDFGPDVFLKRMSELKAPVLAANLREAGGRPIPGVADAKLVRYGDVTLGVIGLTEDNSPTKSKPGRLEFAESLATATRIAAQLRKNGADMIVLIAHAGRAMDEKLFASGVAEIILSGDDHDFYLRFNEKTAIIEAAEEGWVLGAIDLTVTTDTDNKGKRKVKWWPRFRYVDTADVRPDRKVTRLVAQYQAQLSTEMDVALGRLMTAMDSRNATVRGGEAAIGNLFADALREQTKADVALINGGGFRAGKQYDPGTELTRRHVLTELAFVNKALILEVTGKMLLQAFEQGFTGAENELGRFPQISGMSVKADLTKPDGRRVIKVLVGGKPVKPNKTYTLATNEYLAGGGDGYAVFKTAKVKMGPTDAGLVANMVMAYIRAKGEVAPVIDGRIQVRRGGGR
jgi:2',3'-cyclic-nucleotide 2'-phosphodiesterase (5'-nucleotidase family)